MRSSYLLGSLLACSSITADASGAGFTASDSLKIQHPVDRPAISDRGELSSFSFTDWQEDRAVEAHKSLGRLIIRSRDGQQRQISAQATDATWSPSGQHMAFFEGLGAGRQLIVASLKDPGTPVQSWSIAGAESRYSARHFEPVWSTDGQFLLVAEADTAEIPKAISESKSESDSGAVASSAPYTLSSGSPTSPLDQDFRDHTLWRVVRIDISTHQRQVLTPFLALRELRLNPSGDRMLLAVANLEVPGQFMGDIYAEAQNYFHLNPIAASSLEPLPQLESPKVVGWIDARRLLARSPEALLSMHIESAETRIVSTDPFVLAANHIDSNGEQLIAWGSVSNSPMVDYAIAPPVPHQLVVGSSQNDRLQLVLDADDQQEVLDAFWLDQGLQLLIHTRALDDMTERLVLWTREETVTLLEDDWAIGPIGKSPAGDYLVFAAERADAPAELFEFAIAQRRLQQLTRFHVNPPGESGTDSDSAGFVTPVLVSHKDNHGSVLRGLLYLPMSAASRHHSTPLIVSAYARQTDQKNRFNPSAQMHVAQGYAYLLPDVFPVRGALRQAYLQTIPPLLEQLRQDYPTLGKAGFIGGSLGAYAGLVLVSHTGLFSAAVLRAPPSEFTLSWATGKDRDAELLEYLMAGQRPDQNPAAYRDDSPLWKADQIRTPVMFLHGTNDQQVPLEQSLWVFQTMRRLGHAPAELRIYPGADHSVVRGSSSNYLDYYQQVFSWWQKYL